MTDTENHRTKNISELLDPKRFQPKTNDEQNLFFADEINSKTAYSTLYHGLTTRFKTRPVDTITLAIITSFSRGKKWCWYSQRTFSVHMNVSIPTVNESLKRLKEENLIERGGQHKLYKTIQWRAGPRVIQELEYIQKRMDSAKEERSAYKKQAESHLRDL